MVSYCHQEVVIRLEVMAIVPFDLASSNSLQVPLSNTIVIVKASIWS